jgi:uncharacterized membrane protein
MSSRVFLSMFLSSSLILPSLFIPFLYLLFNDFWFYSIIIFSLFMLNYSISSSFNIMDKIENLEIKKVDIISERDINGDINQLRRSTRIQKIKEKEAAEALLELSKGTYI